MDQLHQWLPEEMVRPLERTPLLLQVGVTHTRSFLDAVATLLVAFWADVHCKLDSSDVNVFSVFLFCLFNACLPFPHPCM